MIGCLILSLILGVLILIMLLALDIISLPLFLVCISVGGVLFWLMMANAKKRKKAKAAKAKATPKPEPAPAPKPEPAPAPKPEPAPAPKPEPAPAPKPAGPASSVSQQILNRFDEIRQTWVADRGKDILAYNKKPKKTPIALAGDPSAALVILKAYQLQLLNQYLEQAKPLADLAAALGFTGKLEENLFSESVAAGRAFLAEWEQLPNPEAVSQQAGNQLAQAISGSPNDALAKIMVKGLPELSDLTLLEAAKALGDKRMVAKLTNHLDALKRQGR